MPTVQQILNNIDLYRNSYTSAQKVSWMDTIQKQIYQDVPHVALPYEFTTISGEAFYALPDDCDPAGPKTLTIETKAGSGKYRDLPFIDEDSTQQIGEQDYFYSILSDQNLYLNPLPTDETEGKKVYLMYNKRPSSLSSANLTAIPDLEEDYHELLELGVKIRMARERGEIEDKNNFQADFNLLYRSYVAKYKNQRPGYPGTIDKMPRMRRGGRPGYGRRISDLIPEV